MTGFFLSQIQGLDPLTSDEVLVAQNVFFGLIALVMILAALKMVTTENIVHAALYLVIVLAGQNQLKQYAIPILASNMS